MVVVVVVLGRSRSRHLMVSPSSGREEEKKKRGGQRVRLRPKTLLESVQRSGRFEVGRGSKRAVFGDKVCGKIRSKWILGAPHFTFTRRPYLLLTLILGHAHEYMIMACRKAG